MRKTICATGLLVGSLACSDYLTEVQVGDCADVAGQECEWHGEIAPGQQIEIKGITGDIRASLATGSEATVSWIKQGRHSDPAEVKVVVVQHGNGVTICAVYPDVPGQPPNECRPGDEGHNSVRDNDVEVDFWVSVPASVVFNGQVITGDIVAEDLESDAFASTVTGSISVSTSGLASAWSVTGSVFASIGLHEWDRDLTFCVVTGGVTVEVPVGTNADLHASVVTGSIYSDFPLSQEAPGIWRGILGVGGRRLTVATVTGSVRLKRGG